nr:myb-like protein A isoform X2 [Aedes albopictus]
MTVKLYEASVAAAVGSSSSSSSSSSVAKVLEQFRSDHGSNGTLAQAFTAGGEGSDVETNNIQDLLNDTDAPNDVLYMVCGVVIAMLLVGLIIVLVAVTISKLRKREESSVSPVTATNNVEAAPPSSNHNNTHHNHHHSSSTNNHHHNNHHSSSNNNSSQLENGYSVPTPVAFRQSPSSVWVFPPLPPQPNLYHYNANSQDALVHNEKTGFKGLKRQLSGRFKRLVSRKSHEPAPAIPPELKPQLKTIYVY